MSCYRCDICEEFKDADYDGCEEHRQKADILICEECHTYSDPEYACNYCDTADAEVKYCKITDQYFHEGCVL
jgi:hypothetical protein